MTLAAALAAATGRGSGPPVPSRSTGNFFQLVRRMEWHLRGGHKKTHAERAVTISKRNASYVTMEAATRAREWQENAIKNQKFHEATEGEAAYREAIQLTIK